MAILLARPTLEQKLDRLIEAAGSEVCLPEEHSSGRSGVLAPPSAPEGPAHPLSRWVYPLRLPGGSTLPVLKILQSSVCKNRCSYCAFSAGRDDMARATLTPAELTASFLELQRRGLVRGLFLSSGICGRAGSSMERMLQTVELLRLRQGFTGYIHLKILPGTPPDQLLRALQLADRVSLNLEAAHRRYLHQLAPDKQPDDLLQPMRQVGELLRAGGPGLRARSQTTQFVVGAAGESDQELLATTSWLYRELRVSRAYFSPYRPPRTGCWGGEPVPGSPRRAHRLYQADFLLRCYGFGAEEVVFDEQGLLPAGTDPKEAWARLHPELFPVDVQHADEPLLLRVPGIGPLTARRLVAGRRSQPLRSLGQLAAAGASVGRAAPWIELDGRSPERQLRLFEDGPPPGWRCGTSNPRIS